MNRHNFAYAFFLFAFLFVIAAFQFNSIRCTAKLEECIGDLVARIGDSKDRGGEQFAAEPDDRLYPGDAGDWRIWGFSVEPRTLNPLSAERNIYTSWITQGAIFESLLVYDFQTLKLKPHLAESYDISGDGLEITFTLRDDIHFSDGEPVTTDDVIFTYETVINPQVDAPDLANLFKDVKEVVRVSGRVVKFVMKQVYFKSLENVCFWEVGVFPEHIYKFQDARQLNDRVSNSIGSGPYVFDKWEVGREVSLRRNNNYWGVKPKLERIVYRFISNDTARMQALRAGEIDMLIPSPEQYTELIEEDGFADEYNCLAYWNPAVPFFYIAWNNDTPLFADKRVRRAMTHIVDRDKIVSSLLKGNGKVVTGPFYHKSKSYDAGIEPWPYDPERAKQLLDEAGWVDSNGNGIRDKGGIEFSFKFTMPASNTLSNRLGKLLKDSAAKIGIEVNIDPVEWSILMTRVNDRQFQAVSMGWGGHILQDPFRQWHSSQIGNRGANYSGFSNPGADAIIEQARRMLDENKRAELFRRLHAILHDEQPYTFLYTRPTFRIVDKRFKNVRIYPLGLNYFQWYVPINNQIYGANYRVTNNK
ncbi:MAG: peptide-binding protein [Phycisphaerae bacterium]|nr:peptide-binding protein [Phycisphaerae bacterium]